MKRLPKGLLILALILSAAPCSAQRKVKGNGLARLLFAKERQVIWDAVLKKEMKVLNYFLADDYLDVSDVGVFNKQETLKVIPDLEISSYSLSDFKLIVLSKDAAIVIYSAVQHWKIKGEEAPRDRKSTRLNSSH